jgi:hypothetical protein
MPALRTSIWLPEYPLRIDGGSTVRVTELRVQFVKLTPMARPS